MSHTIRKGFGRNQREISTFQKPYVIQKLKSGKVKRIWKENRR